MTLRKISRFLGLSLLVSTASVSTLFAISANAQNADTSVNLEIAAGNLTIYAADAQDNNDMCVVANDPVFTDRGTYTAVPTVSFSGGDAVATALLRIKTTTVSAGGAGYTVGDVLTVTGGTGNRATLTVSAVTGGAITAVTLTNAGSYNTLPATTGATVTGGTGTGATFNLDFEVGSLNFSNSGSAYSVAPTVTFSPASTTAVTLTLSNGVICSAAERSVSLSPLSVLSTRQSTTTTLQDTLFEDLRGLVSPSYTIAATVSNFADGSKTINLGANPDGATTDGDADAPGGNALFATLDPSVGTISALLPEASADTDYTVGAKTSVTATSSAVTLLSGSNVPNPGRVDLDGTTFKLRVPGYVAAGNYAGTITVTIT